MCASHLLYHWSLEHCSSCALEGIVRGAAQCTHQCVREGPAMLAGLISLAAMQYHDIAPDVITQGTAISARQKGQQCQQALYLLRAVQHHDVVPGVTARRSATNASEESQQCR